MVYFVVFRYKNRETLYHFEDYGNARDHFDDLAKELPAHGMVALYLGDRRSSVSRGCCEGCPSIEKCYETLTCARLDGPDRRS